MVRVRQKKINTKSNLTILRESDLSKIDTEEIERAIDATTGLPKIESGVESKEEREHHLQVVISAAQAGALTGKESKISIPTPEAIRSDVPYDRLFPARFSQPATYIRFSSTVEDSIGTLYCMNELDEQALNSINSKQTGKKPTHCSEEWFEQIINSFEDTTAQRQPFAAVDHPPVLSFEELQAAFDENVYQEARPFARDVYEYWKERRTMRGDQGLMSQLKTLRIDSGQEADDSDPYVCFRRREHRQARKTRGRDAQVIEKLKKLRKELEEGRFLLDRVKAREKSRREDLALSRTIFDQRAKLRHVKRENNFDDNDEELLVNQKAPKRRLEEQAQPQRPILKIPAPRDGVDTDAYPLAEALQKREREVWTQINISVAQHDRWNRQFVDETLAALYGIVTPEDMFLPSEARKAASSDFVGVKVERTQQPTPPSSVVADSASEDDSPFEPPTEQQQQQQQQLSVRWASPVEQKTFGGQGRYRRRVGRGGRVMLDRHNLRVRRGRTAADEHDRFSFDRDSGDESDPKETDLDSTPVFLMRAHWGARESMQAQNAAQRRAAHAQQQQQQQQQLQNSSQAGPEGGQPRQVAANG